MTAAKAKLKERARAKANPNAPSDGSSWREDLALLADEHRLLRETIAALDPARLRRSGEQAASRMIRGIAAHDMYHAGQIRALRALWGRTGRPRP